MTAVGFNIQQIVDNVGGRGRQAEAQKGEQRRQQAVNGERMGEQQRHKDEQILGPLVHASRLDERFERAAALLKLPQGADAAGSEPDAQAQRWVRDIGLGSGLQERQVWTRIADVSE